ncbi:terminase small subunit [Pseudomonas oryzihabitans]|uniref:terminase small subunit n=1 Tax=Pseudomonas oryzihabitans TaxID=47885 RepID=UPI00119F399B|nr:terminase small subunit [Pseudomonas oryzihabitans]
MALTEKKRRFADALLSGASNKKAAIDAGYSEKTAPQAGSKLAKDADVVAYLERRRKFEQAKAEVKAETEKVNSERAADTEESGNDPIAFLERMMANELEDPKLRIDAAKALLPYKHAKKGELGKKEQAQVKAAEVAQGRFGSRKPPLSVVR